MSVFNFLCTKYGFFGQNLSACFWAFVNQKTLFGTKKPRRQTVELKNWERYQKTLFRIQKPRQQILAKSCEQKLENL